MPEENIKNLEGKKETKKMEGQNETGNTGVINTEAQKGMADTEEIGEAELGLEQKKEIERRKEIVERQKEKLQKEKELPKEEQETVNHILEEAKKAGPMFSTPSNKMIADRLVKAVTEGRQRLGHVLRAVEQFGDPFLFDNFRDELTQDANWRKLEELGEI